MPASVRPEPLSRALETRANSRKWAAAPGPNTWARSWRWQAARSTCPAAPGPRRLAAASTARAFVESLTTSVFRTLATTRFWLIGATALQVPRGATGDSSIPVNRTGSSCHSRLSTAARRRGSDAAGRTNRSCCQRRITAAAVTWSARALATAISTVCRSVGDRSCARASHAPAGRARRTRSAARSWLSGIWLLSQTSRPPRTVCARSALSAVGAQRERLYSRVIRTRVRGARPLAGHRAQVARVPGHRHRGRGRGHASPGTIAVFDSGAHSAGLVHSQVGPGHLPILT